MAKTIINRNTTLLRAPEKNTKETLTALALALLEEL